VPEVHQFPDRDVFVGLGQRATAISGDLNVTREPQVVAVEAGQLGGDALDTFNLMASAIRVADRS